MGLGLILAQIACLARELTLPVSVCDRVANIPPAPPPFTIAVRGGRPSPEPSFTSLQQTLTARPRSVHQAREQSLSVGECDRGVDITPLTVWPLTLILALKAVPHGCRHLLFTSMCSTIPTSPDSGLTSRCSWTAKANPPPHGGG